LIDGFTGEYILIDSVALLSVKINQFLMIAFPYWLARSARQDAGYCQHPQEEIGPERGDGFYQDGIWQGKLRQSGEKRNGSLEY
jgi:hypothetical protein